MEADSLLEITWQAPRGKLRGFLVGQIGETTTADDLLQDAFLKLHRRAHALYDKASPRARLYRVAHNAVPITGDGVVVLRRLSVSSWCLAACWCC